MAWHRDKVRKKLRFLPRRRPNPMYRPLGQNLVTTVSRAGEALERISLAGIARIAGVSERWLQHDVNDKYKRVPRQVIVKKRVRNA